MRCKVCDKSFRFSLITNPNTKKVAEELQVCGTCQRAIITQKPNYGKKLGKHITTCAICGVRCDHYNSHETCGLSSCRGKWLRLRKQKETIRKCIKSGNYELLDSMKITTIQKLGFKCIITLLE